MYNVDEGVFLRRQRMVSGSVSVAEEKEKASKRVGWYSPAFSAQ